MKFIVKISPNIGVREGDYIIDSTYGLSKALSDSSMGMYNQVQIKLIPKRTETTVSIFNGGGLYKVSMDGEGIGSGVDQKKAIKYLFKGV